MLSFLVLGFAAGGGFPQWNCNCPVCRLAWWGDPRVTARTQSSVAVTCDVVLQTQEQQQAVQDALRFKCNVLWARLDAMYHASVAPGHIPPGAFVPEDR